MDTPLNLNGIREFLSGPNLSTPSKLQLHLLRGWKPNTLHSYNSAVKKYLAFYELSHGHKFTLPASPSDIYEFCLAAGRTEDQSTINTISAKTLSKYISGLQAWHTFHNQRYPHTSRDVVKIMLRASERVDALTPPAPKKPAVMIYHLLALYNNLFNRSPKDTAILDCAICAFWGMARLAELTYDLRTGQPPWSESVLVNDAVKPLEGTSHILLLVRGAKTAKPGSHQAILLNAQDNQLCPVKAVLRRVASASNPNDALFSYIDEDQIRKNLRRSDVVSRCQAVWKSLGWTSISGHSFRVGGASLRAELGVPHLDIKKLGRWTSNCYTLYLREYSSEERSQTTSILKMLNDKSYNQTV